MATPKKKPAKRMPAKKNPTKKSRKVSRAGLASEVAWPLRLRGKMLLEWKLALSEYQRAGAEKRRIGLELSLESAKPAVQRLLLLQKETDDAARQLADANDGLAGLQKQFAAKHGLSPETLENLSFDPDSGAVFLAT
jgi:hypothetical protein